MFALYYWWADRGYWQVDTIGSLDDCLPDLFDRPVGVDDARLEFRLYAVRSDFARQVRDG